MKKYGVIYSDPPRSFVRKLIISPRREAVRLEPKNNLATAIKADGLKPRFDLIPWDAIAEIQKVYQFGARKYSPRNWEKGFDWLRLWNAAMRHMTAWEAGETADPETKLSHTVHAAFCILALVAHEIRNIGTDNRYRPEGEKRARCNRDERDPGPR